MSCPFEYLTVGEMVKMAKEALENSVEMTKEEIIEYDADFGYSPDDED